jgi:Tfp pilus assembly protein FimT
MRNLEKQQKLEGFSLFELIVTMGILLILSIIVFPIATQKAQQTRLDTYASELVTDLYFQQQQSTMRNESRGVLIESNGYTLFDGESSAEAIEKDIRSYPNNIRISSVSFSMGNEVLFPEGNFKPSSFGTLIISDGTFAVQVYINKEGLIGYERL